MRELTDELYTPSSTDPTHRELGTHLIEPGEFLLDGKIRISYNRGSLHGHFEQDFLNTLIYK